MLRNKKLRMMTEIAIFASIGLIFDLLTVTFMPQGGGLSLKMLPIIIISIRWGIGAGMTIGFLIGLLGIATGGTIYHWAQAGLDYCLANAFVGVIGILRKPILQATSLMQKKRATFYIVIGVIVSGFLKFFVHVVSGVIFFSAYANGQPIWIYSIVYNASHSLPSLILTLICSVALLTKKARLIQAPALTLKS